MNIIINGANGRMGRMLTECAEAQGVGIAARISRSYFHDDDNQTFGILEEFTGDADVVIDFSNHSETGSLLGYCVMRHIPVVIGTTGQTEEELARISALSRSVPVFLSGNMSIGIALLADLFGGAASA